MGWFLWILIGSLFLLLIYGQYLYIKNKPKFELQKSLSEYWGIFIALIFTLLAFNQANQSIENSTTDFNNLIKRFDFIIGNVNDAKNTLDSVKSKLSDLPSKIDSFSNSIKSLNIVVNSQKMQLNNTLTEFNKSLQGFTKSIDQMAERFNRKPKLTIDYGWNSKDSSIIVDKIAITNFGSLTAELYTVRLHLSKKGLIKIELNNSRMTSANEYYSSYQIDYGTVNYIIPDPQKPFVIDCKIVFKSTERFIFDTFVYYRAAFGNDGVEQKNFTFNN